MNIAVAVTELFATSDEADCFGTMLNVEGLEKRVGLSLARSQSRSHLMAKIRHLGLVSQGLVYIPAGSTVNLVSTVHLIRKYGMIYEADLHGMGNHSVV